MEAPILIAGAGVAGLALAAALSRDGRECVVLEERPELASIGGGITLWPNAMAALDAIGVGDDVRRAGEAIAVGRIQTSGGRTLRVFEESAFRGALGGPLVAIRRGALLDLLHAAGPQVRTDAAVQSFRQTDDGVEVTTADGEQVTGAALVGADGYRSVVARGLSGPLRERYAGYPAWRAVAPVGGSPLTVLFGAGREFGVVPLGDATYWYAAVRQPRQLGGGLDHLRKTFAGWPEPVATMLDSTPVAAVSCVDILDRQQPRRWYDGRVAIIGDAAHAMRPHLGQGGCQALVDAAVLADRLHRHPDPTTAFAAYAADRQRTARRVARMSREAGRVVDSRLPLRHAMPLLPDAVALRGTASVAGRRAFTG